MYWHVASGKLRKISGSHKLSSVYIFLLPLCLAIYCDCYKSETSGRFSAFIHFNRSVNSDGRFADEEQQFPWWGKMVTFFPPTPISQYSESLDVIPGLLKSRGAFSEEEFRGKQVIPKWPVLFLISEFYKELQKD